MTFDQIPLGHYNNNQSNESVYFHDKKGQQYEYNNMCSMPNNGKELLVT